MKPSQRDPGAVAAINVQLLFASGFGFIAWACWPSSAEWWGIGVGCVIFALAALAGVANALRGMIELYRKNRVLAEYMALGDAPKAARLASDADLRKAGMVE